MSQHETHHCMHCHAELPPRIGKGSARKYCGPTCKHQARRAAAAPCSVEGCTNTAFTKGWCTAHYQRWRHHGDTHPDIPLNHLWNGATLPRLGTCSVTGCNRSVRASGLCAAHHSRKTRGNLDPTTPLRTIGQGWIDAHGYRYRQQRDHPNAHSTGKVAEHVIVMTEQLGRALMPGESVHHLNGIRDDNRPENLELWVTRQPSGQRVTDRIADAIEILRRYAPDALADQTHTHRGGQTITSAHHRPRPQPSAFLSPLSEGGDG